MITYNMIKSLLPDFGNDADNYTIWLSFRSYTVR